MHIWALTYFEEVGHITECCYFDAMNFFWSDYCSPKWELEVQHSGHMWVQCLPMGTKWQCIPMGMKVQHSGHMSAMRLKFPFSMFQRLNQHRSHGPIFSLPDILDFVGSTVSGSISTTGSKRYVQYVSVSGTVAQEYGHIYVKCTQCE